MSIRRRHTRCLSYWSSDVCSSHLMSSVEELFETAENPTGLVGTAECEPRPTWSEKPELFETADSPAGLVGTGECEPRQIGRASCGEREEGEVEGRSIYVASRQ